MMKICKNCGYCGEEKTIVKGSLGVEIALWVLGLFTFGILWIVALIYSIWRFCSKTKACPECSAPNMIPLYSPAGKKLAKDFGIKEPTKQDFFYFEGHPCHKIGYPDDTVEISSGSGHYITPYEAYFSGISKLGTPCRTELLTPEDTTVSFSFKENKTKDFPILLEMVKKDNWLQKNNEEYNIKVPMSEWKEVKSIFDITKKWKNTSILVGGSEVDKSVFSKLLQCLENKAKSTDKNWCLNLAYSSDKLPQCLGCRRLDISTINFDDFLEERENYFRIKKEDILKIIQEKAQTLKFCPFWDANKIWQNYLRIIPAISFNDKRFVCIEDEYGIRAEVRHDIYEKLSSIREYTNGKILSKK